MMTRPLFGLLTLALAILPLAAGTAQAQEGKRLVTVVTSAEPQTQLMAMVLTMQAVQQGAQAHILLCGPGGDIALRAAPASVIAAQPPRDMSPQRLMQAIIDAGATVEVCALYLPGRGGTLDTLLDGVGIAKPPAMAGAMMDDATRVWSF
jgi:predicted peroxiredoxin